MSFIILNASNLRIAYLEGVILIQDDFYQASKFMITCTAKNPYHWLTYHISSLSVTLAKIYFLISVAMKIPVVLQKKYVSHLEGVAIYWDSLLIPYDLTYFKSNVNKFLAFAS